jgi:hypothetical protein
MAVRNSAPCFEHPSIERKEPDMKIKTKIRAGRDCGI